MIRAAAKSGIDFKQAKPFDPWWWLRLSWLLNEVEADGARSMFAMQHSQHVAALDYSAAEAFKHHWDAATNCTTKIYNSLYPWMKIAESNKTDVDKMRNEWIAIFGDPEDPVVKERLELTVKLWTGDNSKKR